MIPLEVLSLKLVHTKPPEMSQLSFKCSYQPVTSALAKLSSSIFTCLSRFWTSDLPYALQSLMGLRRVVDFQLFSFFFARIEVTSSKPFTCQTGNCSLKFFSMGNDLGCDILSPKESREVNNNFLLKREKDG